MQMVQFRLTLFGAVEYDHLCKLQTIIFLLILLYLADEVAS